MDQRYQQLDPVRNQTTESSAESSIRTSNGVDPKTIETLKAARNQVMQAESPEHSRGADKSRAEDDKFATLEISRPRVAVATPKEDGSLTGFTEKFVQKLASIEREKAAVDEEMAKVKKLWSSLVEKKKQLEARSNELTKVKDKLKELDKEMSDVLKSQ